MKSYIDKVIVRSLERIMGDNKITPFQLDKVVLQPRGYMNLILNGDSKKISLRSVGLICREYNLKPWELFKLGEEKKEVPVEDSYSYCKTIVRRFKR